MVFSDRIVENLRNFSKLRNKLESFEVGAVSVYLMPYPNGTGMVVPFRYLASANTVVICHETVMANAACREPTSFIHLFEKHFKSVGATTAPSIIQVSYADLCNGSDSKLLLECVGWLPPNALEQASVHMGAANAPAIGGASVAMYTRWKGYVDIGAVSFRGMLSDFASSVIRRRGVLPTAVGYGGGYWKHVMAGEFRHTLDPHAEVAPKHVYLTTHADEDNFVVKVSQAQCHVNRLGCGLAKPPTPKQIQAISTLAAVYVAALDACYRNDPNQSISYHVRRDSGIALAFLCEVDTELWCCMKLNQMWGVKRITKNGAFTSNFRITTATLKPL